jgi:hypothetical protein
MMGRYRRRLRSSEEVVYPPYPELERAQFWSGWWKYSESRTAQRDADYTENAQNLMRLERGVMGVVYRLLYGTRRWKPARISAKQYHVEDQAHVR